jgi:hypothetical protein
MATGGACGSLYMALTTTGSPRAVPLPGTAARALEAAVTAAAGPRTGSSGWMRLTSSRRHLLKQLGHSGRHGKQLPAPAALRPAAMQAGGGREHLLAAPPSASALPGGGSRQQRLQRQQQLLAGKRVRGSRQSWTSCAAGKEQQRVALEGQLAATADPPPRRSRTRWRRSGARWREHLPPLQQPQRTGAGQQSPGLAARGPALRGNASVGRQRQMLQQAQGRAAAGSLQHSSGCCGGAAARG